MCTKPPGVKGALSDGTVEKHHLWINYVVTGKIIPGPSFALRSGAEGRSALEGSVLGG